MSTPDLHLQMESATGDLQRALENERTAPDDATEMYWSNLVVDLIYALDVVHTEIARRQHAS